MKRFRPAGPRQNTSHQVLTVRTSKPHWRLLLTRCFVKLTLCISEWWSRLPESSLLLGQSLWGICSGVWIKGSCRFQRRSPASYF